MLYCGSSWKPKTVERVIEQLNTSTRPVKVATDDGIGYLKGMGNPQGNETLALELVGTELAANCGLSTPDFALIEISDLEIEMSGGQVISIGPAFVSKEVPGLMADLTDVTLKKITNPKDVSLLVMFDTWIRNFDRFPPAEHADPEPKFDNLILTAVGKKIKMIIFDHTHAFAYGTLDDVLEEKEFANDTRLFGNCSSFAPYISEQNLLEAALAIENVKNVSIKQIINSVPNEWGISQSTRLVWAEQLIERRQKVRNIVFEALVPQGQLGV